MVISFLKKLVKQRFFYFVVVVIFLVILADRFSEARKNAKPRHSNEARYNSESKELAESVELPAQESQTKIDSLIAHARTLEGIPYQYAGKSPEGFDCSGFIYYLFQRFDIDVPAGSANQYNIGKPVAVPEISKGDLLFFSGTREGSRKVGHVGLVISEKGEEIRFIHSSSGGNGRGITINRLQNRHYKNRFLGARRIDTEPSS